MKITKATYTRKCEMCNHLHVFVLRDKNTNPSIKDSDIPVVISNKSDEFIWCEHCKQITLQKVIAHNY